MDKLFYILLLAAQARGSEVADCDSAHRYKPIKPVVYPQDVPKVLHHGVGSGYIIVIDNENVFLDPFNSVITYRESKNAPKRN